MALTQQEQDQVWRGLMRYWSREREAVTGISKADLLQAVVDTDTWIEANQVSFNNGLSNLFKTNATQAQKTIVFCAVAAMRVNVQFARALLGEVD